MIKVLEDRPLVTAVLLFLTCASGAGLLSLLGPWPQPLLHDEFGYLLLSDTFANGRLTNPPHPHWQFFETFHVLQQPSYTAKYPPLQGGVLAVGQVLTGRPIVGVWLSTGLMVAAVYWALLQWTQHRWALLGAVLLMVQVGIVGYWAQSFWGGAVAATGGALAIGASRALMRRLSPRNGLILGVGLAILANSRPFEGLLLAIALGGYLLRELLRKEWTLPKLQTALLPTLVVGIATLIGMGLYNQKVTGDPFLLPYDAYEDQYGIDVTFVWDDPNPLPDYRHEAMESYYRSYGLDRQRRLHTVEGLVDASLEKLHVFTGRLVGPGILALLTLPLLIGAGKFRFAAATVLLLLLAMLSTPGGFPHYFAPATAFLYLLIVGGLRAIAHRSWFGFDGGRIVVAIVLAFVVTFLIRSVERIRATPPAFVQAREYISSCMQSESGQHVVFVTYDSEPLLNAEWVYNGADIDDSDIVWARSRSAQANEGLRVYYEDRRSWTLEVGSESGRLISGNSDDAICEFRMR